MKLHVINTGLFKMDGGAMFGVVPKTIWNKLNPADENNLGTWAMRCLLIEDGDQLILIDTGIGDKQSDKFFSYYYLHGNFSLETSLKHAGFQNKDITDVFLTHLHFDHCGGAVKYKDPEKTIPELTFPNARYWSNESHWQWATKPNPREKASFLKENIQPIEESEQLHYIDINGSSPFMSFDIIYMDGHTEKQMLPIIRYKDREIVFMADMIPSVWHIPLPYIISFDTRPLISMKEKKNFLNEAVKNDLILFFEHDPVNECAVVQETEKGIRVKETFKLEDL
ncbi:MBL fold metallo-hydrolase [Bacteroidota bacterium]